MDIDKLIYNGIELKINLTLGDYEIDNKAIIVVYLKDI